MTFITLVIGFVVFFIVTNGLRRRISKLEQDVYADKNRKQAPSSTSQADPLHTGQVSYGEHQIAPPVPLIKKVVREEPSPSLPSGGFGAWIKEDWLLKLGALLLIIGFGWFTTYAFLHNWIGPVGRITVGIFAGIGILALGWWRIRAYAHQGSIFTVLGSTIIVLTIFAAREVYGFFTPFSALASMFVSVVFVAFMSVRYRMYPLALASIVLAGIIPFLTGMPANDFTVYFWYLLIVVLGSIWVVAITGWRALTAVSLVLVFLYSIYGVASSDSGTLLLFEYVFAMIFFVANTVGILKIKEKGIESDIFSAAGNGLLLIAWIIVAAQKEWQSVLLAVWAIIFSGGAFMVYYVAKKITPFYVYSGIGVAMIAAATAIELSGAALVIAYIIETGFVVFGVYAVTRDVTVAERASILFFGPVLMSFKSITSYAWNTSIFHEDFFVLAVLAATLFIVGYFFHRKDSLVKSIPVLITAASIYVYIIVWLSTHVIFSDDTAVMISLVVYTIVGLIAYVHGRLHNIKGFRLYGGLLLGFVVGRLLLVDVWAMEIAGRIFTFFIIGTLLMSTAFIGRKKKEDTLSSS